MSSTPPISLGTSGQAEAANTAFVMKHLSNTAMPFAPITDANRVNAVAGVCDATCHGVTGVPDKFEIFKLGKNRIAARRMDADAPWTTNLQITRPPRAPTTEEQPFMRLGELNTILFGSVAIPAPGVSHFEMPSVSNTQMLITPITDANRAIAVPGVADYTVHGVSNNDTFEVFRVANGYIGVRRMDIDAPWGMGLRLLKPPRAPTESEKSNMRFWNETGPGDASVYFGSTGYWRLMVKLNGVPMPCARITEANRGIALPGVADSGVHGEPHSDKFEIFVVVKGYIAARRIDQVDVPWGMGLTLKTAPRAPTDAERKVMKYAYAGTQPVHFGPSIGGFDRVFNIGGGPSMLWAEITDLNKNNAVPGIADSGVHGATYPDKFEIFYVARGYIAARRIDAPNAPWAMDLKLFSPPRRPTPEERGQMEHWVDP